jgi:GTP-binding protein YchF
VKAGIVGLPSSGKTTLFEALVGANTNISFDKPNIGTTKVFDKNIVELAESFNPKKTTFAELTFVDIPGVPSGLENSKRRNEIFSSIKKVDVLIEVVNSFTRDDLETQISSFDSDLILMDLDVSEKRLGRIKREKLDPSKELEHKIIAKCLEELNEERPLRNLEFSEDDINAISSFEFFTLKPTLYILNIRDASIKSAKEIESGLSKKITFRKTLFLALPAGLEKELSDMKSEEADEFLKSYGLELPALPEVVKKTMELMNYNVFYTVGEDEVRSWLFEKGLNARRVAGKIHSDIERGFIAAEVISFEDFKSVKFSFKEAKEKGLLRIEGEKYDVKDKEVVHFRFNV